MCVCAYVRDEYHLYHDVWFTFCMCFIASAMLFSSSFFRANCVHVCVSLSFDDGRRFGWREYQNLVALETIRGMCCVEGAILSAMLDARLGAF